MAKKKKNVSVLLVSSEKTGCQYVKMNNDPTRKLSFRKYDRRLRKHVVFNQTKIKS